MDLPRHVLQAATDAAAAHPTDPDAATDQALKAVRRMPDFNEFVESLVRRAIQDAVYAARHAHNVRVKRQQGVYGPPPAVLPSAADDVARAYESVYSYRIGGTVLGDLTGDQLPVVAAAEIERSKGHQFNAALVEWLRSQGVTGDRRVRDVVAEKKLEQNFRRIHKRVFPDAA